MAYGAIHIMDSKAVMTTLTLLSAALVLSFFLKLYKQRRMFKGLPKPPHHPLLGNLGSLGKTMATLPPNAHPHLAAHILRKEYNLPPIFYLDLWPAQQSILVIVDPDVAFQVTQQRSLPKNPDLERFINPLAGPKNMVLMEGMEWKLWRSIFNPGFASGHIMKIVPSLVDDCLLFIDILAKHAEYKDICILEEAVTRLTIDIIGRVVLDTSMHAQTSENEYVTTFRDTAKWLPSGYEINPFIIYNPIRPLKYWYNMRKMNRYLEDVLDKRFTSKTQEETPESTINRSKPIVDLALDTYQQEFNQASTAGTMDATFKRIAIDQIKTFMFAGHDTTSSTICYTYHLLSTHPLTLQKIRQEHSSVLGPDISRAPALIKETPHLLNKLHYTLATIKETLRLYPPASSVRVGEPGFSVEYDGTQYPTEGFMVWPISAAIHRRPDLWKDADEFIPERWLVEKEDDPLAPVKGAWRPFEFGPRNCIGQELALLEMRMILALTVRLFDIRAVYEELDRAAAGESGAGDEKGVGGKIKTVEGDRAYQMMTSSAKPADGMPVRITRR